MSVQFPVDDKIGYAVGYHFWSTDGIILKTTDGGSTWSDLTPGTLPELYSVHFPVSDKTGYIAGAYGTILKTTNGGATWESLSSGTNLWLFSVQFPVDTQTGYSVGGSYPNSCTILKTTNGGTTWANQISGTNYTLFSVNFPVDVQTGWVVGALGTILKTTDGGGTRVEEEKGQTTRIGDYGVRATPNPFTTLARIPGHEAERFALYDIAGRRVGTYKGERIGMDLRPGV
jgi:photosystem II stability/assembly factor-like uncharacterized protein